MKRTKQYCRYANANTFVCVHIIKMLSSNFQPCFQSKLKILASRFKLEPCTSQCSHASDATRQMAACC